MAEPVDLQADLRERWRPINEQIDGAERVLCQMAESRDAEGRDLVVYTGHLLVNKQFGFWTTDVEVVALAEAVYHDRHECLLAVRKMAEAAHRRDGGAVVGGWTIHSPGRQWAVFEDIMAVFPAEVP